LFSASSGSGVRDTAAKVGISVLSAGAGIAGGIIVARNALQKKRPALGIPLPTLRKKPTPVEVPVPSLKKKRTPIGVPTANKKIEFRGLAEQVGEAGRQFGRLAHEVQTVREKAEQIARIIG
jgi:hypothetical protein